MIPRRLLLILVCTLPILLVSFGVLMGAMLLSQGLNDAGGAVVIKWIGIAALMLIAVNLLLLVGALGIRALEDRSSDDDRRAE